MCSIIGVMTGHSTLGLFFLITWFTDPPTRFCRILKKKKKLYIFVNLIFVFCFTNFQLSVPSSDKGGGQINYGVQGTQELEPTDIAREETRHGDRMID